MATYKSPFTKLRQQLHKHQEFLREVLDDVTDLTQENLTQNTPGKKLPDEWQKTVEVSGRHGEGRVFNTRVEADPDTWEEIMGYLNFGTRAHGPVTAQALHWIDKETGEDVFAKWVKGIKAAHFMETTQDKIEQFFGTLQRRWEDFSNGQ